MINNLAVIAMACNEDNIIERLVNSLKNITNEIHISIDKKTTDNTYNVAKELGANLYEHEFLNNSWADTRNYVMEQVEANSDKEWFLWLDADEWFLSGKDALEPAFKLAEENDCGGISVMLTDFPINPDVTPGSWLNVKIMKRGIRYERRRHEVVPANVSRVNASQIVIGHKKSQKPEVVEANEKLKKDLDALVADYNEFQDKRSCYYLADALQSNKEYGSAITWCEKSLDLPNTQAGMESMILDKWAICLRLLGKNKEAREVSMKKLLLGSEEFGEACFDIGGDSLNLGDMDNAEFYLKMAISAGSVPIVKQAGISNPEKCGALAYYALALLYFNNGDMLKAAAWLGKAIEVGGEREKFNNLWKMIINYSKEEENAVVSGN